MIPAHDSSLAAIAFDWYGTKLATASEKVSQSLISPWTKSQGSELLNLFVLFFQKGTVIRVFSIPQGKRLFEFRRGVRRYVHVWQRFK